MTMLVTADLHLTTNPRDEYRWGLFPWLHKQVLKYGAKALLILGDVTDKKDRHPAELVNRLVPEVRDLSGRAEIIWLKGNHDYINADVPFFRFVDAMENVRFVTSPLQVEIAGAECLLLPHTRDYKTDWKNLPLKGVDHVFTHQTYDGCRTENGTKLAGIPPSYFDGNKCQVWSGDIHVPQRVGRHVEYVGSPYRIRFGDDFEPRVLWLSRGRDKQWVSSDLHFPTVNKHLVVIKRLATLNRQLFPEGDQVKVRMELHRRDLPLWKEHKQAIQKLADERGWQLFGPELVVIANDAAPDEKPEPGMAGYRKPSQVLKDYASEKGLDKHMTALGLEILKKVV